MELMINQSVERESDDFNSFYFIGWIIHKGLEQKVIVLQKPRTEIRRFEDKIIVNFYINFHANLWLKKGCVLADFVFPSSEYKNIPMKVIKAGDVWYHDFVEVNGNKYSTELFLASFEIDCNSDHYFDREMIREKIPFSVTFHTNKSLIKETIYNKDDEIINIFDDEISKFWFHSSFEYSNKVEMVNDTLLVPVFSQTIEETLYKEYFNEWKIKYDCSQTSIINEIFTFEKIPNTDIYIRGYDLFMDYGGKQQKFTSRTNIKLDDKFEIVEGYDWNDVSEEFVRTNSFKGINFCDDSISPIIFGDIYAKVGTTNFKFNFYHQYENHINHNLNLEIKQGEEYHEGQYKKL